MSAVSISPLDEKVDAIKSKAVSVVPKTEDYALKFVCAALSSTSSLPTVRTHSPNDPTLQIWPPRE